MALGVNLSNLFCVFRNHAAAVLDVKKDLTDLTELVEVPDGEAFMVHPG